MIGKRDMGEQTPRAVEDADRALSTLFGGDDPDPGARVRLWSRIQRDLGPQTYPWYRRIGGSWGGSGFGFPIHRAAAAGVIIAVMGGALLIAPSLGGGSTSAQVLEAVDDLAQATSAALSDAALTEAELAELRELANALLLRIENDPSALADLDLSDLTAAIASLQAVEALLVEQQAPASMVVTPVGRAAEQVEQALQNRDPHSPLLAATSTRDDGVVGAAQGRRSFQVADAGTVVIDARESSLLLVAARPAAGWTAVPELTSGREINVRFELGNGREVEFEAELEDGLIEFKIDFSEDDPGSRSSGSSDGRSDESDSSDDSDGTATATVSPTGTPTAVLTPSVTSTPSVGGTSSAGSAVGSIASGSSSQSIRVGVGGTVVVSAVNGLTLVSTTPAGGWALVRQEVESDGVRVRFGQGTTQWRFEAEVQSDGSIHWEVSMHLNEDSVDGSNDDD